MPVSGFVDRFKGKVRADALYTGPRAGYLPFTENISAGGNLAAAGNSIISSSSNAIVCVLQTPPQPGGSKMVRLLSVSSGVFLKAPSGYTFDGTNPVAKSTVAAAIRLLWETTSRIAIESVYPQSTVAGSILTLSATT